MTERVRPLTDRETRSLASAFGIEVDEAEVDAVTETVNGMLGGLDAVYDVPLPAADETTVGDRRWHEPTENPHNALSYRCDVSSTADGVLDGQTVGVKDIIAVAGVPMSCGSAVMRGHVPQSDATVVERLLAAGATVAAKTNLDEFAGGGRGQSFSGPITNPHDDDRIAGGSSGGSAVAVATGLTDVALGTDTGGSVRMPAGFCGVVGLKPTYGLVPLSGIVENTYTQDHVGPLARTVVDAAAVLEAIAGKDSDDTASMAAAGRDDYHVGGYVDAVASPPDASSLSIGVLEEGFGDAISPAVVDRVEGAIGTLADGGAGTTSVSVPSFDGAKPCKNITSYSELADLWRTGGASYRRGGAGSEAHQVSFARRAVAASAELNPFYKSRIVAGARLTDGHHGRYYTRAQQARKTLRAQVDDALDGVDVLALPTMAGVAPRLEDAGDPGFEYAQNTRLANVTGHPAITIPAGTVDGLPVGLQLVGRQFDEKRLLSVAARVEASDIAAAD